MEQHPIPQDITGFKFKLVGDMTLQQFGYLAGGALLAYLSFTSGLPFFIKWPIAILFGFGGFALAFLPIEERPLDRWIISFIRAIYSPTQYVWKKGEALPSFFEASYLSKKTIPSAFISAYNGDRMKFEEYLKNLPKPPTSSLDTKEQQFLQKLGLLTVGKYSPPPQKEEVFSSFSDKKTPPPLPPEEPKTNETKTPSPPSRAFKIVSGRIIKTEESNQPSSYVQKYTKIPKPGPSLDPLGRLQYQNEILTRQAASLREEMGKLKETPVFTIEDLNKLKELAQRLAEVEKQKNKAEEELIRLRQKLMEQKGSGVTPTLEEVQPKHSPRVKFLPSEKGKHAGLPIAPQTPNIICGLVTDSKGEILPGVIIVVKDKDDNPVRAIKTNKIGQFSISTPLPNGVYTLELEKEGYSFDIIEIEAKGEIIPPIEIKAK